MEEDKTIGELTRNVAGASTDFEKTNTELKRKYLIWNIEAFKTIASRVSVGVGAFGTGYPFYALDQNLEGKLPIIQEQIRYNRKLVIDGIPVQRSIWECESCLRRNYSRMPDLKTVCKPCPNMLDTLKPRKIINRLPDMDMWLVCQDGHVEEAQSELEKLLKVFGMRTSDVDPLLSMEDVSQIARMLKKGELPSIFLPIDSHIMEYSRMKELIEQVPDELMEAKEKGTKPYLPIQPKSYRKQWQYDDEAYNFVYDFLSAFTTFSFPKELQQSLDESRRRVATEHTPQELFEFLMQSATEANFRRFHNAELEDTFLKKMASWQTIKSAQESTEKAEQGSAVLGSNTSNGTNIHGNKEDSGEEQEI